jgi:hypothetical protein
MSGIVVYNSLEEALKVGYRIIDRISEGYLVRIRTDGGWALALVKASAGEKRSLGA